jgi:hypothetical protein
MKILNIHHSGMHRLRTVNTCEFDGEPVRTRNDLCITDSQYLRRAIDNFSLRSTRGWCPRLKPTAFPEHSALVIEYFDGRFYSNIPRTPYHPFTIVAADHFATSERLATTLEVPSLVATVEKISHRPQDFMPQLPVEVDLFSDVIVGRKQQPDLYVTIVLRI